MINAINPKKWPLLKCNTKNEITCYNCAYIHPINSAGNCIRRNNPKSQNPLYICSGTCVNEMQNQLDSNVNNKRQRSNNIENVNTREDFNYSTQRSTPSINISSNNNLNHNYNNHILMEGDNVFKETDYPEISEDTPNSLFEYVLSPTFPSNWTSETKLIDLNITTDFPLFKLLGPSMKYVINHCKELINETLLFYYNKIKIDNTLHNWKCAILVPIILFTMIKENSPIAQLKEKIRILKLDCIHIFKIKHFPGFSKKPKPAKVSNPYFQQISRMNKYLAEGFIGKAAQALVSDDITTNEDQNNNSSFLKLHPLRNTHKHYEIPEELNNEVDLPPINFNQVLHVISHLDTSKAAGIDRFSNKIIKSLIFSGTDKKPNSSGVFLIETLYWLINSIYTFNSCPLEVLDYFDSDSCTMIQKAGSVKQRPIKIGTLFKMINDKIRAQILRTASKDIFKDMQYINENNSADKLIHSAQASLTIDNMLHQFSTKDTLYTDFSSAFQNIDRTEILKQLAITCPELVKHFQNRFNNQSKVHLMNNDNITSILNSSGVPQGSPCSSNNFAYGANSHNQNTKNILLETDQNAIMKSFADDNSYKANHISICQALQYIQQNGALKGLFLNPSKSLILLGYKIDSLELTQHIQNFINLGIPVDNIHINPLNATNNEEAIQLQQSFGHITMGIPVGHDSYVKNCMDNFKNSIEEYFAKIQQRIPDNLQLQMHIISKTAIHKITHIMRGLPYHQIKDFLDHFNHIQKQFICNMLNISELSDETYKWICHPKGVGLSNPDDITDAAYISSIVASMDEILKIMPNFKDHCIHYYSENLEYNCGLVSNFVKAIKYIQQYIDMDLLFLLNLHQNDEYDIKNLQHDITTSILENRFSEIQIYIKQQHIVTQQLFETFKNKSTAKQFLLYTPKNSKDPCFMENSLFKVALSRFCLIDIISIPIDQICTCTEIQQLDRKGNHLQKCKQIGNTYSQNIMAHDNAVLMLQKICQYNGIKTEREVLLKSQITSNKEDQRRIDLILKLPNSSGMGYYKIATDISIISCISKNQERGNASILKGDDIFKHTEKIKYDKYLNDCNDNQLTFVPVIITKEGVLSNTTAQLFQKLFNYGKEILNRDNITANYFLKWFCANIIKDQTKILVNKINLINNSNIVNCQLTEEIYEREQNLDNVPFSNTFLSLSQYNASSKHTALQVDNNENIENINNIIDLSESHIQLSDSDNEIDMIFEVKNKYAYASSGDSSDIDTIIDSG